MTSQPVQPMAAWFEIPVTDLARAQAFYDEVCGWTSQVVTNMGPNPIVVLDGGDVAGGGHLYEGKPAAAGIGATIHVTIKGALEAAAERAIKAGGQIVGPIVPIPHGRFQYMIDPDGNSIGLFELAKAA